MSLATIKKQLLSKYGVVSTESFEVAIAVRQRVNYLKKILKETERNCFVLGISGGVDSTVAGRLAQQAVHELRLDGYDAYFVAVRLPYKEQVDEKDARKAIEFIKPDLVKTINIGDASDVLNKECINALFDVKDTVFSGCRSKHETVDGLDFHKGNIKARMRMIAQYHLAGVNSGLVLGTDHNAECITGFYTMHGDGACDLTVLDGLNKRQVRLCARYLGASKELYLKVPTADLEELNEQVPDEVALGVTYDEIDDFLEGKVISEGSEAKILNRYKKTMFKRRPHLSFCCN